MKPFKPSFALVSPLLLLSLCLPATMTLADEPKNHDFDVVRGEAGVPPS